MAYALGKFSQAQCDRCGFVYKYLEMKMEWNGLKVCPECYEPRQPQDTPARISSDPETLYQARPEVPLPQAQLGVVTAGAASPMTDTNADTIGTYFTGLEATSSLGTLTVTT